MKTKILLLLVLAIPLGSFAQQSQKIKELENGNTHYLYEGAKCKVSLNLYNSDDEHEYCFQNINKITGNANREQDALLINPELVHLTISFNEPMNSNTDFIISNNVTAYGKLEVNWSGDKKIAEIDLEPGNYEIFAMNNYWQTTGDIAFVLLSNFVINSDTTAVIDFSTMANNSLSVSHNDEIGQEILYSDSSIIKSQRMVNVEFPDECYFHSCSVYSNIPLSGNLRFSDFNENFKIIVNYMCVKDKKLYISDIGQINGIFKDTLLSNSSSTYKSVKLGCQFSPTTSEFNYLTFDYGAIFKYNTTYMLFLHEQLNDDFPFASSDTLVAFLSNNEMPGNRSIFSFITDVSFWEKVPDDDFPPKRITTEPMRINHYDSVAFTKWNRTILTPVFPDESYIMTGNTSPFITLNFENKVACENCIVGYAMEFGQTGEQRYSDQKVSTYEITREGELLAGGLLTDFYEPFIIDVPGIYGFSVENKNFKIREMSGISRLEASFNMTNYDANPPVLSFVKLLDSEGKIDNSFNSNEPCELIFSAFDKDIETGILSNVANVELFYKKMDSDIWIKLSDEISYELFDSVNYGGIYTCNITEAFALFDTPGYLDLKLVITDLVGNSITQTLHPVAYIAGDVKTPCIEKPSGISLEVWPNPIKDCFSVAFNLMRDSKVKITLYDLSGRLVKTLLNSDFSYGKHEITLDSSAMTTGLYSLIIETDYSVESSIIIRN